MRLKGKVALITGASKGIGKGIAMRYSQEGAAVVIASRSLDLLEVIASDIQNTGSKCLPLVLDVRKPESIQGVVDESVKAFGHLDIMVNNAGISMACPSEDLATEDWIRAVETDLFGVFYGCQSAGRQMMEQGGGCIINITSVYGSVAAPMRAAYCASKAAANMLTKVLASEWASKKVRVNAIAPGYIRTELVQELIDKGTIPIGALEKRTPIGRIGEVEDLLELAVYVASDGAAYLTGSILTIDGGWTAYGYL